MLGSANGSTVSVPGPASNPPSLTAPAGPRYPTRARAAADISGRLLVRVGGCGHCGRRRQRDADRFGLLRRELELALAADHLLGVDARLSAVADARRHDARALVVEQRDRERLLPGELVVGVV